MTDAVVVVAVVTATLLVVLPALFSSGRYPRRDQLMEDLKSLDTSGTRAGNLVAAARLQNQLDVILEDHAYDVRGLDRPFAEILASVLESNPYVPPLFSRFDQTAARACHHRQCRERAVEILTRNVRVKASIAAIRDLIARAKGDDAVK